MSTSLVPDFWRNEIDRFTTPNLTGLVDTDLVSVVSKNFRDSKMEIEHLLFFEYENKIFFPIWFEFRSINNNLLFLIKELKIQKTSQLREILRSSLRKEEGYVSEIVPILYRTKKRPRFCTELEGFDIDGPNTQIAKE